MKGSNFKASPTIPSKATTVVAANPYLQGPDPSSGPASMAGISTKQRLSLGANVPINPKEAMEKQLQPTRTSNFAHLKFNKSKSSSSTNTVLVPNELAVESPTINSPELTLNAINTPANKEQSPIHVFADSFQIDSPIVMEPSQILP
jgi:hypothetical protein